MLLFLKNLIRSIENRVGISESYPGAVNYFGAARLDRVKGISD